MLVIYFVIEMTSKNAYTFYDLEINFLFLREA